MRFNDAVLGVVLVVLALGIGITASGFPSVAGAGYGAAFFPNLLAGFIAVCGVVFIVQGLRTRHAVPVVELAAWWRVPGRAANALFVVAALVFYVLASDSLGFLPVAFLILFVLILKFRGRLWQALALAAAMATLIYIVFDRALGVPLPRGVLGLLA